MAVCPFYNGRPPDNKKPASRRVLRVGRIGRFTWWRNRRGYALLRSPPLSMRPDDDRTDDSDGGSCTLGG